MKVKCVGIEDAHGVSKKSNKPFDAWILHSEYERANVVGISVDRFFCDKSLCVAAIKAVGEKASNLVGKTLEVDFDPKGFFMGLKVL